MALEYQQPRIESKRLLDKALAGDIELNADGWFDLTLLVTGDRDQAERAHNAYVRKKLKNNETPQ